MRIQVSLFNKLNVSATAQISKKLYNRITKPNFIFFQGILMASIILMPGKNTWIMNSLLCMRYVYLLHELVLARDILILKYIWDFYLKITTLDRNLTYCTTILLLQKYQPSLVSKLIRRISRLAMVTEKYALVDIEFVNK